MCQLAGWQAIRSVLIDGRLVTELSGGPEKLADETGYFLRLKKNYFLPAGVVLITPRATACREMAWRQCASPYTLYTVDNTVDLTV